jgi:NADH-quinone oxidoreductase subunit C
MLDPAQIHALVAERFPAVSLERSENGLPWLLAPAEGFLDLARFLKDDPRLACDSLMCLSGVDLATWNLPPAKPTPPAKAGAPAPKPAPLPPPAEPSLACVYFLHSLVHRHRLTLKVLVDRNRGRVPSVESVWGVAGYFEREIYDLLGVDFPGHHDLRRIMTPDDWEGHPLRKDYAYPQRYHGVELRRAGQRFEDGPYAGAAP